MAINAIGSGQKPAQIQVMTGSSSLDSGVVTALINADVASGTALITPADMDGDVAQTRRSGSGSVFECTKN
jgi:hypothetical protein